MTHSLKSKRERMPVDLKTAFWIYTFYIHVYTFPPTIIRFPVIAPCRSNAISRRELLTENVLLIVT